MRALKVTYRAVFRQPLGELNKLGVRLACDIPVEIYQRVDKWIARRPLGPEFVEIPPALSQESMRTNVERCFETRVNNGWEMFGPDGQPILPSQVHVTDGRVMLLEPEDFTHVQNPNAEDQPENKKLARARCGGVFKHQAFASTLENAPPPTCTVCLAALQAAREARA